MDKINLPSLEQISKNYIENRAALTDFAILLGGIPSNKHYINNDKKLENRTGSYWTCKPFEGLYVKDEAYSINEFGYKIHNDIYSHNLGARLVLNLNDITTWNNKTTEKEFGQYPQQAASIEMEKKLERLYQSGVIELCETRNSYTTGSTYEYGMPYTSKYHIEYEYKGKKYIRVIVNSNRKTILSNGKTYYNGDAAWIKVQPIRWIIDIDNNIATTEKIIFAGIQFNKIKDFINNIFSVDIIPPEIEQKHNNPTYNLQQETRKPQIIDSNIVYKESSNITVVLPYEILENIDTITLESKIGEEKQVVYVKKQQNSQ